MPLLNQHIAHTPNADLAPFLEALPAKWAVYLLRDQNGRPLQLLSVKNLRASLANRLSPQSADEKTRAIPYRQIVSAIDYRRVDSSAEAEWIYAELARELFPAAHDKMIANYRTWWVQVDPDAPFPHYTTTDRISWPLRATTFGPIPTKVAAQKFVEIVEDAFDLCRYYAILTQAPHGLACAYKQMHKCPAPCDGSISLGMYHQMIDRSLAAIGNAGLIEQQQQRMHEAAGAMNYELAGKIKAYVEQLQSLTAGPYQTLGPAQHLRRLAVIRGPAARQWRLMLLTPNQIEISDPWSTPEQLAELLQPYRLALDSDEPWNPTTDSRLVYIARQILLRRPDLLFVAPTLESIRSATQQLSRRKPPPPPTSEDVEQETGA